MADITALIITKDEEKNISDCIASIADFATRILVVDSGSQDQTQSIAESLGAEVYFHEFETHAKQRNWAIDNLNITTQWILRIDADERFTPALCAELEELMAAHADDDVNGFTVEAWLYFMGRRLTHGKGRKRKLIVFKTGKGRIEDRKMDEHTILTEGTSLVVKEKFLHYDYKDLDTYVRKLNWYATREMQDYFDSRLAEADFSESGNDKISGLRRKKVMYYRLPMFVRCWVFFLYMFFIKGNCLNGKEGRIYSFLYHFYYRWLVDAKIYEQKKTNKAYDKLTSL